MTASTSRPRIHWVSPLPPASTDIAEYTRRILPEMAARANVVVWTDAETWDPALEDHALVRRFDADAPLPMDMRDLPPSGPAAEAVFFHIGNSWVFHSGILALARRIPGIVVLHDLAIVEALRDMAANGLFPRATVLGEAQRWYGAAGAAAMRRVLDGGTVTSQILEAFPIYEAALARATAVLAHTGPAARAVAMRDVTPVYRLDLPFAIGPRPDAARSHSGPLSLVQFGHIGPNRRLLEAVEALGRVAGEVDFRLDVFGKVWDERRLRAAADAAGISDRIRIRGFVPEPELDAAIARAHLVLNLRNPTMGEASGSQLRIWNAAALAVVSDLGWYAELPDDTVVKVPADDDISALAELLHRLDADRDLCGRVGSAGRAHLEAAHGASLYAEGIARIAAATGRDAQERLLADAARRLISEAPSPALISRRAVEHLGG